MPIHHDVTRCDKCGAIEQYDFDGFNHIVDNITLDEAIRYLIKADWTIQSRSGHNQALRRVWSNPASDEQSFGLDCLLTAGIHTTICKHCFIDPAG